jgi:hypothetical protein
LDYHPYIIAYPYLDYHISIIALATSWNSAHSYLSANCTPGFQRKSWLSWNHSLKTSYSASQTKQLSWCSTKSGQTGCPWSALMLLQCNHHFILTWIILILYYCVGYKL